jgi:hypothetical protein
MKRILMPVLLALLIQPMTGAHSGPHQKIMGTVISTRENGLEVKGTDGKTSEIVSDATTKVLRGAAPIRLAALKEGERVVVIVRHMKNAAGNDVLMAEEVKVGTGTQSKSKQR